MRMQALHPCANGIAPTLQGKICRSSRRHMYKYPWQAGRFLHTIKEQLQQDPRRGVAVKPHLLGSFATNSLG